LRLNIFSESGEFKFAPVYAMQAYGGKPIAHLSLHSDSNWKRVVRFTSRPPYSGERDKPAPTEYYTVLIPDSRSGRFKGENNLLSRT